MEKAYEKGDEFLHRWNLKENKAKKNRNRGDFSETSTGDIRASTFLTRHAKERSVQRGVSQKVAIKCTKKSGAVVLPSGAVVTVIPEGWVAAEKKRNLLEKERKKSGHHDISVTRVNTTTLSPNDKLPNGCYRKETKVEKVPIGLLLGKKHANIKEMISKQDRCINESPIKYQIQDRSIIVTGPQDAVSQLVREIVELETKLANSTTCMMNGPPLPKEELPDGHIRRRIVVAQIAIGQVVGKGGRNVVTLREEALPALINFDSKTGVMHVWGISEKVEEVCDKVAKVTSIAQNRLKQHNQKMYKKSTAKKEKKVDEKITNHNAKKKSHAAMDTKRKGKNKDKKTKDKQNRVTNRW